jgi:hypothetical protein
LIIAPFGFGHELHGGFHVLSSQGGPIRDGLDVRIAYAGSEILRLEIAK